MKAMNRLILLGLLAISGITCKKEVIQPNTKGPTVFYFNGIVNGSPVSYTAGLGNYYMYSSYTQDGNNVYNFTGSLHQTTSSNTGPNSIQITINDYKTSGINASVVKTIDTSLVAGGNYLYLTPTGGASSIYATTFTTTVGGGDPATKFLYRFGDGATTTVFSNSVVSHTYKLTGAYTPTLITTFTSGGVDSISHTVQANSSGSSWNSGITIISNVNRVVQFQDSSSSTHCFYSWNFGDGNNSSSKPPIGHTYAANGLYHAAVQTTDSSTGKINTTFVNVVATDSSSFNPGYIVSLKDSTKLVPNPNAFSNITITYTDASGITYSSNNIAQPLASNFQIVSVSSYQSNELNQATKMLHIKFNCQLKDNSSGKTTTITNGDAVIAVAYK